MFASATISERLFSALSGPPQSEICHVQEEVGKIVSMFGFDLPTVSKPLLDWTAENMSNIFLIPRLLWPQVKGRPEYALRCYPAGTPRTTVRSRPVGATGRLSAWGPGLSCRLPQPGAGKHSRFGVSERASRSRAHSMCITWSRCKHGSRNPDSHTLFSFEQPAHHSSCSARHAVRIRLLLSHPIPSPSPPSPGHCSLLRPRPGGCTIPFPLPSPPCVGRPSQPLETTVPRPCLLMAYILESNPHPRLVWGNYGVLFFPAHNPSLAVLNCGP